MSEPYKGAYKYDESLGTKVALPLKKLFNEVCEYEGIKPSEKIRQLIMQHVNKVRESKRFQKWRSNKSSKKP